jgi:tRNA(Ile2) C34 agmatinyltransferase TiaS
VTGDKLIIAGQPGYKALAAGVPLVLVNPAYTSQTCHQCGEHGIRNGKSFKCPSCSWSGDADFNNAPRALVVGSLQISNSIEIPSFI